MGVTADARLGHGARHQHVPRRRPFAMARSAIEVRSRGIGQARVPWVVEPKIRRMRHSSRPRDRLGVILVVTRGAGRRRWEHRRRIAARDSGMTAGARRKESRMPNVGKRRVAGSSSRAPDRVSSRRCQSGGQHEEQGSRTHDPPTIRNHRRSPMRSAPSALIPGSRPAVHSSRTRARRWLQFTVVDGVFAAIWR